MAIGLSSSGGSGQYLMSALPLPPRQQQQQSNQARLSSTFSSSHQRKTTMRANVLIAVAAVVSLRPIMTMAEGRTAREEEPPQSKIWKYPNGKSCPYYGCPLFPIDVVKTPANHQHHQRLHAPEALESLSEIRNKTRQEIQPPVERTLSTAATHDMATITMTGYKGGSVATQINQDRAFVVGPYYITTDENENTNNSTERRLLGVFDGHAARGEIVSEYAVQQIGPLLAQKLQAALDTAAPNNVQDDEISTTKRVLHETFVELDQTAPADPTGGCTASVVLLQGQHVYIANAGDSQSIIGIYRKKTQQTSIVYISREDKPSLPDERQRVEDMGGYVYIPVRGTSRVVYVNPRTGAQTGLAMSRSLGDWAFGKLGVIPDPIVDVLNIPDVVQQELAKSRADVSDCWEIDDDGVIQRSKNKNDKECQSQSEPPASGDDDDDVHIFAVSATDGMLDYVNKEGIAQVVAQSLFEEQGLHPATACELLVTTAAQGWDTYRQGRYRDDIAIAVSTLRVPASAATASSSSKEASQKEEL
ncbi:linked kinase-associated serine/threonine phosphatase 2C [Seminavis robusta]|uniref:Linked kinase-associated serine/threonine phosphatase 2C n=1 Tax=Seminavis robusta TaxID=568900 RepID=A0A9N8EPK1_9STRA|nr:linked kinase-associated serine/threonine phosphatase 2C [Seminavis robusta]|eukprot:Sro1380_g267770.1 linked kinase-associated serine/threonine phosphatase 2C (532) ;mRNA; f:8601-10196